MKSFRFFLPAIFLFAAMGCKDEDCYKCSMFINGNTVTDQECGEDLSFDEAFLIIEQRNPGSTGGMSCEKL